MHRPLIPFVALLALPALPALAQTGEPPALQLPAGIRARVATRTMGQRIEGTLVSADSDAIRIMPKGSLPIASAAISVPTRDVLKLETAFERKRHVWQGLLIGAGGGALVGLADEVDPVTCKTSSYIACTRAEAVAVDAVGGAVVGLIIGVLVKSDRWTPVALDALAAPKPSVSTPSRRALGLQVTFRF
jgi:hypothetical protein